MWKYGNILLVNWILENTTTSGITADFPGLQLYSASNSPASTSVLRSPLLTLQKSVSCKILSEMCLNLSDSEIYQKSVRLDLEKYQKSVWSQKSARKLSYLVLENCHNSVKSGLTDRFLTLFFPVMKHFQETFGTKMCLKTIRSHLLTHFWHIFRKYLPIEMCLKTVKS